MIISSAYKIFKLTCCGYIFCTFFLSPCPMESKYSFAVFDIITITKKNTAFRKTFITGENIQIVVMNLKPKDETTLHSHSKSEQFVHIVEGTGVLVVGNTGKMDHGTGKSTEGRMEQQYSLSSGSSALISTGTPHNIIAISELKLYTIYSPPNHGIATVQQSKSPPDTY